MRISTYNELSPFDKYYSFDSLQEVENWVVKESYDGEVIHIVNDKNDFYFINIELYDDWKKNKSFRKKPICEECKNEFPTCGEIAIAFSGKNDRTICSDCLEIEGDSTPIGIREIPNYYKGEFLGIRAKDVISDFNLSYNVGTAVTYLLRAGNKPDNSYQQDLEKSLHHIVFELERIKNKEKK